jgi:hypothetical protein
VIRNTKTNRFYTTTSSTGSSLTSCAPVTKSKHIILALTRSQSVRVEHGEFSIQGYSLLQHSGRRLLLSGREVRPDSTPEVARNLWYLSGHHKWSIWPLFGPTCNRKVTRLVRQRRRGRLAADEVGLELGSGIVPRRSSSGAIDMNSPRAMASSPDEVRANAGQSPHDCIAKRNHAVGCDRAYSPALRCVPGGR